MSMKAYTQNSEPHDVVRSMAAGGTLIVSGSGSPVFATDLRVMLCHAGNGGYSSVSQACLDTLLADGQIVVRNESDMAKTYVLAGQFTPNKALNEMVQDKAAANKHGYDTATGRYTDTAVQKAADRLNGFK